MVLKVTDENYKDLLKGEKPVVLDFWAEWCNPCRTVGSIIDKLSVEYDGKIVVGKVNVDENNDMVFEYGIRSIPTLLFFKKGQITDKQVGATGKNVIIEKIDKLL
ncbi:MAG: thioredoxin [Tannerella sp.]|jgi:thioredoxin 1|nr:thioredoxin [Tannerella sp.]